MSGVCLLAFRNVSVSPGYVFTERGFSKREMPSSRSELLDPLMTAPQNTRKHSLLDFSQLEKLARDSGAVVRSCLWTLVRKSVIGSDEHRT